MRKDFKAFLLRGNIVELAVAVIIGIAFGAVVTSLVDDVLTPLIAAIGGQPNFGSLVMDVGDGQIRYGQFLNAIIAFLIIATVMFFVVKAIAAMSKAKDEEIISLEPTREEMLLAEIRDLLAKERSTAPRS